MTITITFYLHNNNNRDMDEWSVALLSCKISLRGCDTDTVVKRKGDPSNYAYIVLGGSCKVGSVCIIMNVLLCKWRVYARLHMHICLDIVKFVFLKPVTWVCHITRYRNFCWLNTTAAQLHSLLYYTTTL